MTDRAEKPIEREVRVEARPETVYAFFTEPEKLVRWMGTKASVEPRPGGVFRLEYGPQGAHGVARGEFVELDRPRRIVFTWGWEDPTDPIQPGESTVEVDLEPDGEGTVVRLRHSGLDAESRKSHEEGWVQFLPALAGVARGSLPAGRHQSQSAAHRRVRRRAYVAVRRRVRGR